MRLFSSVIMTVSVAIVLASLTTGQEPRRPGGFQGPGSDPGQILKNENVQKELKLTEEQLKKYEELQKKALADALTPEQLKRLKQIQLQQRGMRAFQDPEVQTALKLSEDQKEKIKTISEDADKDRRELFKGAVGGGNREELTKKITAYNKEVMDKTTSVLNDDQKKAWKDMLGEPFEGLRQGFGFGTRTGGNFKKKKTNE